MLIRAILGCKKAVNKISLLSAVEKVKKAEITKKDMAVQSNEKDRNWANGEIDGLFSQPADAKLLTDIIQRLESLTNNKMTTRLIDIYRSLNRMYTDVPQPSELLEMSAYEPDKIVEEMHQNLCDVHREIANFVAKRSLTRNKWEVGIQCDVRLDAEKEKDIMLAIAREKELENLRLNNLIKKYNMDIESLRDIVAKEQLRNNALEEQLTILDFTLRASKSKENKTQETAESVKTNYKDIKNKFDLQLRVVKMLKKDLNITETQMQKIFNTLIQWDDELFETKIDYRITEQKLRQVEKAYSEKTGRVMDYAHIIRAEIIKKFNILKRQFDFPWMTGLKQKQEEREAIETQQNIPQDDDLVHNYFESNRSSVQGYADSQGSCSYSRKASIPVIAYQPPPRPQLTTSKLDIYSKKTVYKEPTNHNYIEDERHAVEIKGKELGSTEITTSGSPEIPTSGSVTEKKRVESRNKLMPRDDYGIKHKHDRTRYPHNETLESVMEDGNISTIESKNSLGQENSESKSTVEIRELNQDEVLALLSTGKPLDDEEIKLIQRWIKKSYDKFASYLPQDLKKMLFTIKEVEDKLSLAQKAWKVHRNSKDTQGPIHGIGTITDPQTPSDLLIDVLPETNHKTRKHRSKTMAIASELNSTIASSPFSENRRSPRSSTIQDLIEGEHPNIRKLLSKIMTGHDGRCAVECLHLKRAMALKARYRGKPYPVNRTSIEYSNPPEIEEL